MQKLSRIIEDYGPAEFTAEQLARAKNLFHQRSALFFTPTEAVPEEWIGRGRLTVTLPIPFPNWYEFYEVYAYKTPRLWVDLLQRATGKLRWTPLKPASVRMTRYDTIRHPYHVMGGAKALLDALKESTTGRSDGRLLYYFGAIADDNPDDMPQYEVNQRLVDVPADAHTEITVEKFDPDDSTAPTVQVHSPST